MAKVTFLGTANAVADEQHENTHLVIEGEKHVVLIDCVGSPVVRLQKAGVDLSRLTDIVLTHFHPDHVSGVPLLLMDLWLLGRHDPLNVYGLTQTLDKLEGVMDLYGWQHWPNFFPVDFYRLPAQPMARVMENSDFHIFASPVKHLIPTVGLRVENQGGGKLAYSCDTEPCPEVVELASRTDILIHEASGKANGHSSAAQAGEVASQAQTRALYLIHYPTNARPEELIPQARSTYAGDVHVAKDLMSVEF
jgi:ribonuclease Z